MQRLTTILLASVIVALIPFVPVGRNCSSDDNNSKSNSNADAVLPVATGSPLGSSKDLELLQCLKRVLKELPLGKGKRKKRNPQNMMMVHAHHYDAASGKWNADMRLVNLPRLDQEGCVVWEVGAFKYARDTQELLAKHPHCQYHAFEPVPAFYATLQETWKDEPRVHTHNYGLGKASKSLSVPQSALQEQSTYLDGTKGGDVEIQIKSFDEAMDETGGKHPTLLHMNCEGCEWDMLPAIVETGFLAQIPMLQVGTHNYGKDLGSRTFELCQIRQLLNQTHSMTSDSVAFAWERWEKR